MPERKIKARPARVDFKPVVTICDGKSTVTVSLRLARTFATMLEGDEQREVHTAISQAEVLCMLSD